MAIQPGVGYTFTASSQGENINVIQPWSNIALLHEPEVLQFEVRPYSGVATNVAAIQIAKGAVNFDQSNMPEVWGNPETSRLQAYITKPAVASAGISVTDGGISPELTPWMGNGGYYTLPGDGFYYVAISKLDIDGTLDAGGITDSTLIKTNRPFVSIFKSSDALYGKIFQQTGPSQYVNRTNVQRMDGYDAASTGLSYDFGACHSTWFNPVRYGYDCNVIATIEVTTATVDGVAVKNYDIRQHVVGSICLNTPLSYLGSTLFDYPGVTEADDPYNDNETNGFNQVCNYGIRSSLNTISPITTAFTDMLTPADWTEYHFNFAYECTGSFCEHPFQVKRQGTAGTTVWMVCSGTINNVEPDPAFDTFTLTDGYVWLRVHYDGTNYPALTPYNIMVENGTTVPADTDDYGHIVIASITSDVVTQLVTGSLWSDRIKLGTATATYYFARV